MMMAGQCTPHSFSSWRKRMRRARWKKKPLGPNLPVRASLGMRTVVSHDRIKPARSHPSALKHSYQITLMPQVVTLPQIPGCLSKRLTSGPAAAPLGGVSKEGAAAPSLCRLKGWSRRGRPKSPSWRVFWTGRGPFSPRGENGGCIAHLHRGVTHRCRQASSSKEIS